MDFQRNMKIQARLDERKDKTSRLQGLLKRALILDEALNKDSYKTMEVTLGGMCSDLVIPNRFGLSLTDSVDLLETLSKNTDEEILRLQKELDL